MRRVQHSAAGGVSDDSSLLSLVPYGVLCSQLSARCPVLAAMSPLLSAVLLLSMIVVREISDAYHNKARSPNLNGLLKPSSNEFQNYLDGSSS